MPHFVAVIAVVLAAALLTPATASASGGDAPDLEPQVIGGEPVTNPGHVVPLLRAHVADPYRSQFCGGTLVRADVVLTAAHCVDDVVPAQLAVAVGVTDLRDIGPDDRIPVGAIAIHPAWGGVALRGTDLALLHLRRPVGSPVTLPFERDAVEPVAGRDLVVAGWGARDPSRTDFPFLLQEADVLGRSDIDIDPAEGERLCNLEAPGDDFCFGGDTTSACVGDSGGPITGETAPGSGEYEIVGVVSYGPAGECFFGAYDGGQRVAPYVDWLDTTIAALPSPFPLTEVTCPTAPPPFVDVLEGSIFRDDISCVHGLDIARGRSALEFDPAGAVTREQMAAFLARLLRVLGVACPSDSPPFVDVAPGTSFAYLDIACVNGAGIAGGTRLFMYEPGGFVTREQMAAFVARTLRALGIECPFIGVPFVDVAFSFASRDIACVYALDIARGRTDTEFDPSALVTREQMAAFLARLLRAIAT